MAQTHQNVGTCDHVAIKTSQIIESKVSRGTIYFVVSRDVISGHPVLRVKMQNWIGPALILIGHTSADLAWPKPKFLQKNISISQKVYKSGLNLARWAHRTWPIWPVYLGL